MKTATTSNDAGLKGLSRRTIALLNRNGITCREDVLATGGVGLLLLQMFGMGRLNEVNDWLGEDAPPVKRKIAECKAYLENHGYTVTPPNDGLTHTDNQEESQ